MRKLLFALFVIGLANGCNAAVPLSDQPDRAPSLKADGPDVFDTGCTVHLRSAERMAGSCDQACQYSWKLTVDVDPKAITAGGEPKILYYNSQARQWRSRTLDSGTPKNGFVEFTVLFSSGDIADDFNSGSAFYFIPLLQSDHRVFDHNGLIDPYWTYILWSGNQWAVGDNSICGAKSFRDRLAAGSVSLDVVVTGRGVEKSCSSGSSYYGCEARTETDTERDLAMEFRISGQNPGELRVECNGSSGRIADNGGFNISTSSSGCSDRSCWVASFSTSGTLTADGQLTVSSYSDRSAGGNMLYGYGSWQTDLRGSATGPVGAQP